MSEHKGYDDERSKRVEDFFASAPEPEGTIEEIIHEANRESASRYMDFLNYNADVHNDCTPCPVREGQKCDLIGTGIHEGIERHLLGHGWSQDKIEGIRLGGLLCGKGDLEVFHLAHDGILLFQPTKKEDA